MADTTTAAAPAAGRGGFKGGRGGAREGGFGGPRGPRRDGAPGAPGGGAPGGRRPRRSPEEKQEWTPVTKIGRLVKNGRIKKLEELFLFSVPIKEYQVIDHFLPNLKDEVMKITPVQKQSAAGQRTRFKAYIVVGDHDGHIGLGVKCSKEVATAIRAAICIAKLAVVPVRRGYWGNNIGRPHTVPIKLTGRCGSVRVRLVPAPRGAGCTASRVSRKVLQFAGIEDCYTGTEGNTKTAGNFALATYDALRNSYGFLTPNLWKETALLQAPYQAHSDFLQASGKDSIAVADKSIKPL